MDTIEEFAEKHSLYPLKTIFNYKIYKDITIKKEVTGMEVIDGLAIQFEGYYFKGKVFNKQINRVYIPMWIDSDVDLEW